MFDVNYVRSFEWSDEPINNLVLPASTKKLIKALVEKHSSQNAAFDDFVRGKGQGLVMNLFGKPGVGKTLTVEATSERELNGTSIRECCSRCVQRFADHCTLLELVILGPMPETWTMSCQRSFEWPQNGMP